MFYSFTARFSYTATNDYVRRLTRLSISQILRFWQLKHGSGSESIKGLRPVSVRPLSARPFPILFLMCVTVIARLRKLDAGFVYLHGKAIILIKAALEALDERVRYYSDSS